MFLDEVLCNCFVCGVSNGAVQRLLLTEDSLTMKKAVDIALALDKNAKSFTFYLYISSYSLAQQYAFSKATCYRCSHGGHDSQDCRFRDASCH